MHNMIVKNKSDMILKIVLVLAAFTVVSNTNAAQCPGVPKQVSGTVYCDNTFTLWVDGKKTATDPIDFTPHQAVKVAFDWDGTDSITYAIQCEDYASDSGYEYTATNRPQLGDGALIARFDDGMGTETSAGWKVFTSSYGPTDSSLADGCSATSLDKCAVEDRGIPEDWTAPDFDDSHWKSATVFTAAEAGWGRTPTWTSNEGCCTMSSPVDGSSQGCDTSVSETECLVPRVEFAGTSADFIWGAELERDNRVLFRYTAACENN